MIRLTTIAPLFLLSGTTALLYQVAFGKRLATVFGATAYAVSAVLAAFMAGLALGAYLGGRYGHRIRRPLVAYGLAEIAVAAVCAITPWLFAFVSQAYVATVLVVPESLALVTVLRMVLTGLIVIVPTVAMGVTLPWLARAIAGQPGAPPGSAQGHEEVQDAPSARHRAPGQASQRLALLYAVNTVGGALGALLGAYAVLPALGVDASMRAAALVNLAIGLGAVALGWRRIVPGDGAAGAAALGEEGSPAERPGQGTAADGCPDPVEPTGPPAELGLLVALAFASGLLVFAAEVVDTHLLALLIGNSAYAFGLMLAVFLICLSVGAALAQPLERRWSANALPLALASGAAAQLLVLPLWDQLPRVFLAAGPYVHSWGGREMVRAAVALAVLVAPTVCMGLTFPLLLRRVAGRTDVARHVGRLTAVNTVGAIAGSLLCGYLVLPALGSEWTLRAIAVAFASCCVLAAWWPRQRRARDARRRRLRGAVAAWLACTAAALLLPGWDLRRMTNGANVYFSAGRPPDELVFVREDVHGGWTSVARRGTVHTLYTNGKFQGDDGRELVAQRSFAHFPSLFVEHHGSALVIGLGTGTTLGTIAGYPYRQIHVAETSPAVVEAARKFFAAPSGGSLDDPRVALDLNDGRNVLLLAREPYDLITIELSSVWFAGAANLYSAEFYELCRRRLAERGVLQQWLQLHHIRRRELAVVLRTLRTAFPHVALFVAGRQGIAVAASHPLVASRRRLEELSQRPAIRASLSDGGSVGAGGLAALLDALLLSGEELERFIRDSESDGGPLVSTDANLYLEYATPKGNTMSYAASLARTMELLEGYRTPRPTERHLTP